MRFGRPVFASLIAAVLIAASGHASSDRKLPVHDGIGGEFSAQSSLGRRVSLSEFRGRVVLLFFGYTSCPDACPVTLAHLQSLTRRIGPAAKDVQVLLVTLDPEIDTAERLQAYLGEFDPRFVGLTGTREETDRIAGLFLAKYERSNVEVTTEHNRTGAFAEQSYLYAHSQQIYLLDKAGRTRSTQADVASKAAGLKRVKQVLVKPPLVPKHSQKADGGAKIVEVRLEVVEREMVIDPQGTTVNALTFQGSVPAPLIVVHAGDYVELTLSNPGGRREGVDSVEGWEGSSTNIMSHNIDLHAVTGALGGAGLTLVAPGQEATIRFKATKPGVFVYHCAPGGVMIPYHVVAGMNGAIMVLPRDGLKDRNGKPLRYDKAYYVGEQDFYVPKTLDGRYKKFDSPATAMPETLEVMKTNEPSHVVFNGAVGALTGEDSLTAKVGETVLFIHSQANRDTRPHLIGGHGDYVWQSGSFSDPPQTNLETWFVAGGSAGAAMYTFRQPGLYVYLNHNLIDAVLKGAAAHVKVEGEWNNDLLEQILKPTAIER
jgi:nitrite reductase (NO-forming)